MDTIFANLLLVVAEHPSFLGVPKALRSTISRSSARTGGMGGRVLGRHFMFVDGNDPHDPLVNKQKPMEIRHYIYIYVYIYNNARRYIETYIYHIYIYIYYTYMCCGNIHYIYGHFQ